MSTNVNKWDWEISSGTSEWNWKRQELWSYRHLLFSLVHRNFLLNHQQTILGPLWTLLQPILTLITYVLVFGKLVGLSTGSLPPVLFYFSGIILWTFFNECFIGTSNTYRDNMHIFSKVYFPRIIMPFSVVSTHFLRLLIQLVLLYIVIFYFIYVKGFTLQFSYLTIAFPLAIIVVGCLGLGLGLACSILTAKYRDLSNMVAIAIRLLMFVTPVIYPLASVREDLRWIVNLNPLTPLFEFFRLAVLGEGTVAPLQLVFSVLFTILLLVVALIVFNKQGNKLMDVV